jgi:cell division protein FtsW (lipid II flippase)
MLSFIPRPIRRFVPGTLVVIVGIILVSVFSDNIEAFVNKVKGWLRLGGETTPPPAEV